MKRKKKAAPELPYKIKYTKTKVVIESPLGKQSGQKKSVDLCILKSMYDLQQTNRELNVFNIARYAYFSDDSPVARLVDHALIEDGYSRSKMSLCASMVAKRLIAMKQSERVRCDVKFNLSSQSPWGDDMEIWTPLVSIREVIAEEVAGPN